MPPNQFESPVPGRAKPSKSVAVPESPKITVPPPVPEESETAWTCCCCFKCCDYIRASDPVCRCRCCCPYLQLIWFLTVIFATIVIWFILYGIVGDTALPGEPTFAFFAVCLFSYWSGWILAFINVPPTIGMFSAGMFFTNVGWFDRDQSKHLIAQVRAMLLAFIMMRAGLCIDPEVFKEKRSLISRMAFIPGICEMVVVAGVSFVLMNLPYDWAMLLGSIVAPLSPMATIHSLVNLREKGFGEEKGVASVLLMVTAIDNILLVSFFGAFLSLVFDEGCDGYLKLAAAPIISIGAGIASGFLAGIFITFFPHKTDKFCGVWRTFLLSSIGLGGVLFTRQIHKDGAGYLCAVVASVTAGIGWKFVGSSQASIKPVHTTFTIVWHILQPINVGLMGAEVNFAMMHKILVVKALALILCAMVTRFVLTFLMALRAGFNYKEIVFMSLVLLPKGTPQAGMGPMALDIAKLKHRKEYATKILNVCVYSILVSIPIGPIVASVIGQKLLQKNPPPSQEDLVRPLQGRQKYKSTVGRMKENDQIVYNERRHSESQLNLVDN